MNTIYQKNLAALQERDLDLAQFIDSLETQAYSVQTAASGQSYLEIKTENKGIIRIGDQPNQTGRVQTLIEQQLDQQNQGFFLIFGAGLGNLLTEFFSNFKKGVCILVERDARIFKMAMQTQDLSSILAHPGFYPLVAIKPEHLVSRLSKIMIAANNSNHLPKLYLLQDPQVVALSQSYYEQVALALKTAVGFFWDGVVGDSYHDTLLGFQYSFQNLKQYQKSLNLTAWKGVAKGQVGLVVSSGPSLLNKLPWLKENQDRFVIICADSALKLLLEHGIKPFGAGCMERHERVPILFKDYTIPDDVILFHSPQIMPEIPENYQGQLAPVFRDVLPFSFFPDLLPRFNIGMSCAHLNIMVLLYLGCERIAFMGQDLAFERESLKSHYEGMYDYATESDQSKQHVPVVDNQGGSIMSHEKWIQFREFIELIITHNPGAAFYNVIEKEQGARILGASRIDLIDFEKMSANDRVVLPDFKQAQDFMQKKWPDFKDSLQQSLQNLIDGLEQLRGMWPDLEQAQTKQRYFECLSNLEQRTPDLAWSVFCEVFCSRKKRFDANVESVFSDDDFQKNSPGYIKEGQSCLEELLKILKKGF
ncbi:MAG: motility associated factor glycosyltransferase family protein [Deltaproteobacteria bacterium]|nr:motility associated factor glycosyltransferase family protein [Deltaproteobacteria bacterium]